MNTKQKDENEYETFRIYYSSSFFLRNLVLPMKPSMHHFRFQLLPDGKFYRVRQTIKFKRELQDLILRKRPKNVYFTPVKWLDPINISKLHTEYMLSSPLFFDIDSAIIPTQSFHKATEMTIMLADYIEGKYGKKPSWIVFSGKRGFHIYYWDWDDIPQKYPKSKDRITKFKEERSRILSELSKEGIIVDISVTTDPWRILRVPGTIHGETHLIALRIDNIDSFSLEKARLISENYDGSESVQR